MAAMTLLGRRRYGGLFCVTWCWTGGDIGGLVTPTHQNLLWLTCLTVLVFLSSLARFGLDQLRILIWELRREATNFRNFPIFTPTMATPDRIIDHADRVVDVVTFDLFADDLSIEFDNTINILRTCLTRGGEKCGEGRTTYFDNTHPVIKLTIKAMEQGQQPMLTTSLLIYKKDCYSYCFFADKKWRHCIDSKIELLGSVRAPFKCNYIPSMRDTYGPGSIYQSLQPLSGNIPKNWRLGFLHLVYFFRLPPVVDFMRGTLSESGGNIYFFWKEIDGTTSQYPYYWKKLSSEVLQVFSAPGNSQQTMLLSSVMVEHLSLPHQGAEEGDKNWGNTKVIVKVEDVVKKIFIVKK